MRLMILELGARPVHEELRGGAVGPGESLVHPQLVIRIHLEHHRHHSPTQPDDPDVVHGVRGS